MIILPWINKFIKKNWKKIIVFFASLIVFCSILVIGIKLYIWCYIPVQKVGEVEIYEGYAMSEYVYDTKEDFLERLETWEENGWSSEDIDAIREKLRQYDEDDVLIIWCSSPVKYLCYYRENHDDLPMVYGSYDYQKGEQGTKIYVYITDYEEKIFQWRWG